MYHSQAVYRELFDSLHESDGWPTYRQILVPWIEANPDVRAWLHSFATCGGHPYPPADPEDLCQLYALGRVNETLLLGFQWGRADGSDWPGVFLDEYVRFAEALGLRVVDEPSFCPFYHEVVEVELGACRRETWRGTAASRSRRCTAGFPPRRGEPHPGSPFP